MPNRENVEKLAGYSMRDISRCVKMAQSLMRNLEGSADSAVLSITRNGRAAGMSDAEIAKLCEGFSYLASKETMKEVGWKNG